MKNSNQRSKKEVGVEIHERILGSISTQKRKSTRRRFNIISLAALFLIFGSVFLIKRQQFFGLFDQHHSREITADFKSNTFTQEGRFSKITDSLQIGTDNSQAIYLNKLDNQMVLNVSKIPLGQDDILNIKTGVGGFYKVELPDGSKVNLNANSNLRYSAHYMKDRKLTLQGEAYFEVKKQNKGNKGLPFEVKTEHQLIEVLGTSFNVKTSQSFDETLLYQGRLNVKAINTGKSSVLLPGDLIKVDYKDATVRRLQEGEMEELLAWKEGYLYYDNRYLSQILSDLQKYYEFDYDKTIVPKEQFTIYLARENSLKELINLLDSASLAGFDLSDQTLSFNK